MPKMEKGRPPESKRSRKPAHPVKREVSQEMKSFAESTMNELLGWYGYDKVDLQESEPSDIRSHTGRARRHQVSVLKENSDPKPTVIESKLTSGSSASAKNGVKEPAGFPLSPSSSSFSPHMKDLHSTHVVVPLIKPSAVEEQQNVQIVCVWCQKEGLKRYSLVMGSELKSFCSEKCFAMCRRAYFKRNKAQNENRHGDESSPPPGQLEETSPQLMLKMNSNTRVCDWCKHVRHTKYLDLGAGDDRLQFCSTKCLNQYKMDIFYREARAALTTSGSSPSQPENENRPAGESDTLLTPESWNNPSMEGDSKETVPPKVSTPVSSSSSSSSSVRASVLAQQKERESSASSHIQTGPPMPSTPPPRVVIEQPWVIQKPPSFNRVPIHAQPRNPGSSPHQRPLHTSPQIHTPTVRPIPAPQLLHPYPGSMIPCASTYPHPIPQLLPTLGLPCPQPTVLVPYPIVVPLPVPVPIPIPIPVSSGAFGHAGVIRKNKEKATTGRDTASVTSEDLPREQMSGDQEITDAISVEHKVKTEQALSPDPYSPAFSSHTFPILSCHPQVSPTFSLPEDQRQEVRERQVIQRAICRVKQEGETEFDHNKVEQENGWDENGDEEDSLDQQTSTKSYTGTLKHTSNSAPENASSPADSLNPRASIILHNALNTTSVVTPTASILLNNCSSVQHSMHSSTVHSDPEQRTSPHPESEDVKENVSGGREPGVNCSRPAEQTDCQTDHSDEGRVGAVESDALAADEHAYARSIPPKLREKNAHTVTLTTAHTLSHMVTHSWDKSSHGHMPLSEQSGVHAEIEPALKRRCLRIRDQNK